MKNIKRLFEIPEFRYATNKKDVAFVSKYDGKWKETTFEEYVNAANNLSKGLLDLGVKPNDKIAVISDRNITEWHIIDLALLQLGVQSVPIYATMSESEMVYIFNHAEVTISFTANSLYGNIEKINSKVPGLKHIVTFEKSDDVESLYDLIELGSLLKNQNEVDRIKKSITENYLATIIYTSGTTAMPKGVMLTHKNLIVASKNAMTSIPETVELQRTLSLLPVSHIFERLMLYLYQYRGVVIYFAENIQTVANDMQEVKPHIMSIVPRLLEKIHDKIIEKGLELSGIKRYLVGWALKLGYDYKPDGQNGPKYERKLARARKLVFKKWRAVFGGELKIIICGGSKLQPKIARVFSATGINILEGYALTETSGVGAVNALTEGGNKLSTVGRPLGDVVLKIAKDGEILMKGDIVMSGYYKDDIKTESSFKNGFFKTGDLGSIDEDGFLTITGRKKELFKTSGGKYISPIKLESLLTNSKMIEQVMVIGENEKFPAAIIQPSFEYFREKYPDQTNKELANDSNVFHDIQYYIEKINEDLGQWEKIKKFALTPEEWTVIDGHLTPTMKVKRDIIKSKYYYLYIKIYGNNDDQMWELLNTTRQ
jgi:long-chain acyl-CoA synthetase